MSEIEDDVSTRQQRIAKNARNLPEVSFTAVAHHIDVEWLWVAEQRVKSGTYRAPAVRRVYVPKSRTEKRPIGIPTYEDKIAGKEVQMVSEPIYEQQFYDFSYGFRPGKSQHMALDRLWQEVMNMRGAYVIDLDISKYFDTIDHQLLREVVQRRVRDGVIMRMIGKWLHAGVMEGGTVTYPKAGSPQGGVISPLLSNIYLHEVLDEWFVQQVKPRMRGKTAIVRFADDAVLMFERREDLERVMEVLPKRFAKYGLTMNERKTQKERLARAVKAVAVWCKRHRHDPVSEQQQALNAKLRGHYAYYGITPNSRSLQAFREQVKRVWFKWLNRRSRTRHLNWGTFNLLLKRYPLERPRIYHSYV